MVLKRGDDVATWVAASSLPMHSLIGRRWPDVAPAPRRAIDFGPCECAHVGKVLQLLLVASQVRQRGEAAAELRADDRRAQRLVALCPQHARQPLRPRQHRPHHQVGPRGSNGDVDGGSHLRFYGPIVSSQRTLGILGGVILGGGKWAGAASRSPRPRRLAGQMWRCPDSHLGSMRPSPRDACGIR